MFTIIEILDMAIRLETNGEAFYRDAIEKISTASLRSFLQMLADEEVKHREWFEARKAAFQSEKGDPLFTPLGGGVLEDIIGDQTFSLGETDMSQWSDEQSLFQAAIEFEKDTILFFEMIQSLVDRDEESGELKEIIEEEYRHINLLQKYLEEGFGQKWPVVGSKNK